MTVETISEVLRPAIAQTLEEHVLPLLRELQQSIDLMMQEHKAEMNEQVTSKVALLLQHVQAIRKWIERIGIDRRAGAMSSK